MKTIKIDVPDGFVIDVEKSNLKAGSIVLKLVSEELKWKDFGLVEGFYITPDSKIKHWVCNPETHSRNVYPTKELAEAALALCQLTQWRDKVWEEENWNPDWTNQCEAKYCVYVCKGKVKLETLMISSRVLCFPKLEIAEKFLKQHKTLLETAKPLL